MSDLNIAGGQEIVFPADPKVRATRVLDFFLKCRSKPFKGCQSARVDLPFMFFFPDSAMPKFTGESDRNLFIQEVTTVVGLSLNPSGLLAGILDRMDRVIDTIDKPKDGQLDLPFPSEPHSPDVDPSHEDSPEVLDDARAGANEPVGGA